MKKKIILASLVVLGSIELSAYTYEVNPLIGKNFTESSALVDDSTAYGIRLNKYISEDNAIMFGYTRMNNVDYKRKSTSAKSKRTAGNCQIDPCRPKTCPPKNCPTDSSSSGTSTNSASNTGNGTGTNSASNTGNSNGTNSASNTGTGNGTNSANNTGNGTGTNSANNTGNGTNNTSTGTGTVIGNLGTSNTSDTDINRFYINGLHNIKTKYSRLVPYVYGGFGYEHVENELADNDSQGFFNAGGGLKFKVNDRFSLVSDIQGVKKFRSHDFDILGSIGVGYLFGSLLQPEPEAIVASGLEDVQPVVQKREITVIKVAPQPIAVAPVIAAPTGEYYVQMAAGFKTNMETGCKHTRDLRKAGIDYDIKYTTIKGKNAALVVIGPFETKEEAKSQLPSLRRYSKNAFVKRIKN